MVAKVGLGFLSHTALWKVIKIKINNDWKIKAVTHFVLSVASQSTKKISYFSTWRSRSNRGDEIKTKHRNKSQLLIFPLSEIKRNLTWVFVGKNKQRKARDVMWRNAIYSVSEHFSYMEAHMVVMPAGSIIVKLSKWTAFQMKCQCNVWAPGFSFSCEKRAYHPVSA